MMLINTKLQIYSVWNAINLWKYLFCKYENSEQDTEKQCIFIITLQRGVLHKKHTT